MGSNDRTPEKAFEIVDKILQWAYIDNLPSGGKLIALGDHADQLFLP